MNELSAAMAKAFGQIEKATKSAENPHFKSKYADLGAIIDAVKPPLIEHGLFFTQRTHPSETGVSVETVLHHESGEQMSLGVLYVPANKQDAQGFGSALTYARRYGLQTAFGVPAEDDDGNAAVAAPRDKDPGIHAIKQRLSQLRKDGDASPSLEAFNRLIQAHKDDLKTIRDANHEWWTGDGEDFEGFAAWKDRRKAELTPPEGDSLQYQMLVSCVNECTDTRDLSAFLAKHGDAVGQLDGDESRRFEALYDAKVEALKAVEA